MSLHPIIDKAEVSVYFPDKAYIGSFGRHSQFDAYADADVERVAVLEIAFQSQFAFLAVNQDPHAHAAEGAVESRSNCQFCGGLTRSAFVSCSGNNR